MPVELTTLVFLSTLSLRRATYHRRHGVHRLTYFYPRSPCGERRGRAGGRLRRGGFLSTLSLRRATGTEVILDQEQAFLSTLSLRRATVISQATNSTARISIHALLAESDPGKVSSVLPGLISIHALLAESDLAACTAIASRSDISIHALLAESDPKAKSPACYNCISIHALLAESDD